MGWIGADLVSSDNVIPLSPQWLLSKPGENKPPAMSGVCYSTILSGVFVNLMRLLDLKKMVSLNL